MASASSTLFISHGDHEFSPLPASSVLSHMALDTGLDLFVDTCALMCMLVNVSLIFILGHFSFVSKNEYKTIKHHFSIQKRDHVIFFHLRYKEN